MGVMLSQTKEARECQQPPWAGQGREGHPSRTSRGSTALTTRWFQTSGLQTPERIHFCCGKPPSLWSCIRAAMGFPGGADGKAPACQCRKHRRRGFDPWGGKIPWRRAWQLIQYSCLENPTGRGVWRATIYSVAKSQTRLKWLSTLAGAQRQLRKLIQGVKVWKGQNGLNRISVKAQSLGNPYLPHSTHQASESHTHQVCVSPCLEAFSAIFLLTIWRGSHIDSSQ